MNKLSTEIDTLLQTIPGTFNSADILQKVGVRKINGGWPTKNYALVNRHIKMSLDKGIIKVVGQHGTQRQYLNENITAQNTKDRNIPLNLIEVLNKFAIEVEKTLQAEFSRRDKVEESFRKTIEAMKANPFVGISDEQLIAEVSRRFSKVQLKGTKHGKV